METSKYYTPTIEEFHVGFEYEWRNKDLFPTDKWEKAIIKDSVQIKDIHNSIYELRCKILGIEEIESLGWIQRDYDTFDFGDNMAFEFIPEDISFLYQYGGGKNSEILFKGEVKNKSKLKQLMIEHGLITETN